MKTTEEKSAEAYLELRAALYQSKRQWNRTDSVRWLDNRSATILAWLRRKTGDWPEHVNFIGSWLQRRHRFDFDRIHLRLAAFKTDAKRDTANLRGILQ